LLHISPRGVDADAGVQPRGYRLLAKLPRLPDSVADKIVERYGTLQKLLSATVTDLDTVEGVSKATARTIKDGLARLAETSILDRYS
jgi:diadenylate cyclase